MIRIMLTLLSILLAVCVVVLISRGRLQLKYSLLWLLLCLTMVIMSIWPAPVYRLSSMLGFVVPSNFIIVIGMFLILLILLSLTIIASWQSDYIRRLVQEVALLKKEMDGAESSTQERE